MKLKLIISSSIVAASLFTASPATAPGTVAAPLGESVSLCGSSPVAPCVAPSEQGGVLYTPAGTVKLPLCTVDTVTCLSYPTRVPTWFILVAGDLTYIR